MSSLTTINPYLDFNGNCAEAFKFYKEVLGGELLLLTYADTPMAGDVPPEMSQRMIHASLKNGEQLLMGGDAPPDRNCEVKGITVNLGFSDVAEAERVFKALAESGVIDMPLEKTFWAERFGMVTDRFGIPWMINCAQPCQSEASSA